MKEELLYKKRFYNHEERKKMWEILVKNFFQKFIMVTDTVLDLGSGFCEFINNVKCYQKIAVDINLDSKKYCNKDVWFIKSSSEKIKLEGESVDKIFISNFFEHLEKKNIIKTITELKRILRKNGEILILQPNIRFCQKDYWMFFDHITPIDDRAIREIFESFGFKLKYRILKFLPFTTKSKLPKNQVLIKLYLMLPFLWYIFGKQSFLIFQK